jgi:hypothetical protein
MKALPAARDIFLQVQEIYIKEQQAEIDATIAERRKDIEYIIALKRTAIEARNEEEIIRTHRIFITLFNRM